MSTVIGIFNDKESARKALEQIRNAGITDDKISMVTKGEEKNDMEAGAIRDQNLTDGAAKGGAVGGLAGLGLAAAGISTLAIPGIGAIIAAGPIAAGLTGAAAGGIAGGLVDMGIPQQRGDYYQDKVKSGKILAAVEADRNKVDEVSSYLKDNGAYDVEAH